MTEDLHAWNINVNNTHDRPVWKKALRTAMKCPTRGNRGQVDILKKPWCRKKKIEILWCFDSDVNTIK